MKTVLCRIRSVTGGKLAGTKGLAGVTNGGDSVAGGDRRALRLALAIFFAVGLAFAIVNALSELDERARAGRPVETWEPWCWELTSFLSFLLLAPIIFRLSQRLWPPRLAWPAALGVHLLLSILYCQCQCLGYTLIESFALNDHFVVRHRHLDDVSFGNRHEHPICLHLSLIHSNHVIVCFS